MRIGGNSVTRRFAGASEITRIYLGSLLVFDEVPPAPQIVFDTFTTAANLALLSYTGESGETWAFRGASGASPATLIPSGQLVAAENSVARVVSRGPVLANNQFVQATFVRGGATNSATGIAVRVSDTGNCYWLRYAGFDNVWQLQRTSDGVAAQILGSYNTAIDGWTGDGSTATVRLEAEGTTIRALVNGVPIITVTDSVLTGGRAGIRVFRAAGAGFGQTLSDFGGGALIAAPTAAAPVITTPATISGTTEDTGILVANVGAASGTPAPSPTVNWFKNGLDTGAIGSTVDKAAFGLGDYTAVVTWSNGNAPDAVSISGIISVVAGAAPAEFERLFDVFGGKADGTDLATHVANSDDTWVKHPTTASADLRMAADGTVYPAAGGTSIYMANRVGLANETVSVDITAKTLPAASAGGAVSLGVVGRLDPVAATFYMARVNHTSAGVFQLQLYRSLNGAIIQIGATNITTTWAQGETKKITLSMIDSTIDFLLDGVVVVSASDSQVSGPGRHGLRSFGTGGATPSSGLHYAEIHQGDRPTFVQEPPPANITFTPAAVSETAEPGTTVGSIS